MKVRSKFKITEVTLSDNPAVRVKFYAVSNDGTPENERFHKYTPSGTLEIWVDNPPVAEWFKANLGKSVYLDMTLAE